MPSNYEASNVEFAHALSIDSIDRAMIQTIFFYRLLDIHMESCVGFKRIPLPLFPEQYFTYRVLNEPDHGRPALVFGRKVAECLCQATSDGRSISDFVQKLSQVFTGNGMKSIASLWSASVNNEELEDNVNVAALYTRVTSIVEKLVLNQKLGVTESQFFGPARYTLVCMRELHLRRDMLHVAVEAGKITCVKAIWNSNTDKWPWEFVSRGETCEAKRNESKLARLETPSREVFEFLMEKRRMHCTSRHYDEPKFTRLLCSCAHKGWTDMAAHHLDLGANVNGFIPTPGFVIEEWQERPLINACRHGYGDLVDLLHARGADTSRPVLEIAARKGKLSIIRKLLDHEAEIGRSLLEAARKGWGDIVQELLVRGGQVGDDLQPLLCAAIEQEHISMFQILNQSSYETLNGALATECHRFAREQGLESMARLVEGVRYYTANG